MTHRFEAPNQEQQSSGLLSLELPALPHLSPNDLQAGTAAFLADFALIVDDAMRHGHFDEATQQKITRAETLIGQSLEALVDLSSEAQAPKELATLSLEDLPENVYRALVFLCKHIPEVRIQVLEDPHHRLGGDHPADYNLLYVAFRRALDAKPKNGKDLQRAALRKERLIALVKLEEISKNEIDRHVPYPVELERVSREDIRRGAVELHKKISDEEPGLPLELKSDAVRVLSFLEAVFDPDAMTRRAHDERELQELLACARAIQDPDKLNFDAFPPKLFESVLKLKMADVNLNLAFMGHDFAVVQSQVIARRDERKAIDQPLPFNPFNLAAVAVKKHEQEGGTSLEELYRYDEFTKLQATHRSSIEIMSADAGARIVSPVQGDKPWHARALTFTRRLLTVPISEIPDLFSDDRARVRRERDEQMIAEWNELAETTEPDFLKVADRMIQACKLMRENKTMKRVDILKKFRDKMIDYFRQVDPELQRMTPDPTSPYENDLKEFVELIKDVKKLWENRYYYPDHLESVVEKENYKLVETIEVGGPIKSLQITPLDQMLVHTNERLVFYAEKSNRGSDVSWNGFLYHRAQLTPDGNLYVFNPRYDGQVSMLRAYNTSSMEGIWSHGKFIDGLPNSLKVFINRFKDTDTTYFSNGRSC
ncbi:hypothetical protein EXS71_04475, partial [Candidatus Uhrbacteria bacterium]|nr:hypothetical protein [Candidatus Uhrbacteria bacterium]